MRFRLKFGNSCGGAHGYFAGTDSTRASDINRFFEEEEVKAILCTCGGYGSARLLDKLNLQFSPHLCDAVFSTKVLC